jgi:hypothetical protein
MEKEKLLKVYPEGYKKFRRILFNLYRPILHDKSTSILNQHLIAYIMLGLFTWSFILLYNESPIHWIPFISGWVVIPLTWIYFKFAPQTWDEMYNYEKEAFRLIWKLPHNWKPKK